MPARRFENTEIYDYKRNLRFTLVTTRFNNHTWKENCQYRAKTPGLDHGCIYSTSKPMSQNIATDSYVYVLEMNNDTNEIMGIGLVRNRPLYMRHTVHENEKWNTFSYIGKTRISRSNMDQQGEQLMQVLDHLCFRGKRHLKRLTGIKQFPIDFLYNCKHLANYDVMESIKKYVDPS